MTKTVTTDQFFDALARHMACSSSSVQLAYFDIHPFPQTDSNPAHRIFTLILDLRSRHVPCLILTTNLRSNPGNRKSLIWASQVGLTVRTSPDLSTMHAKLAIFDRRRMIIGSHNLSPRAMSSNLELSLETDDAATVLDASRIFDDWWQRSIPIREVTRKWHV